MSKNGKSNKKSKDKSSSSRASTKQKLENLKLKLQNSNSYNNNNNKNKKKARKSVKKKKKTSKTPKTTRKSKLNIKIEKEEEEEKEDNNNNNNNNTKDNNNYGLYDYEFIDLLDRIRGTGGQPRIPQIILIGSRGCGKTSLLEIITGINLPKGRSNPTICPLEFNIIRSLKQNSSEILCEIYIHWRFNDELNEYYQESESEFQMFAKIEDISLLNHYISQAQNMIYDHKNENYLISPNSIIVNVYANNVEDIRIVDIPGYIYNDTISNNDNDKLRNKFYNDIINIYLDCANNNIIGFMFNISSNNNCGQKKYELLINKFNKYFCHHLCIGIITGIASIKSESELKNEWIYEALLSNRNQGYKSIQYWCGIHIFNDYDIENNINSISLKANEFEILSNNDPWSYLFEIKNKLGSDNMMQYLGELIMSSLNSEFELFKTKLDYRLSKLIIEFNKLPPTIGENNCSAVISHIIHNFINELEKHTIGNANKNQSETISNIEYKFLTFRKNIMLTRPRLATKGIKSSIENNIYDICDLIKFGAGNGQYKTFIIENIINKKWITPSSLCLSSIHSILGTLLQYLSQKHIYQFIHFQNAIRQNMAELLSKLLGKAKKEIEIMLFREQTAPINDIATLSEKINLYKIKLRNKINILQSGNQQLNENIINILSQSWAYFDIVANRFCDNIIQIIQTILIKNLYIELQKQFTQTFLTSKTNQQIQQLLILNLNQKKRKKQLIKQFKLLKKNRTQINHIMYRNGNKTTTNIEIDDALINDIDDTATTDHQNILEQIKPANDTKLIYQNNNNNNSKKNTNEGIIDMQTNISNGELDNDDYTNSDLIPIDFYTDYMNKKKQLDLVVPKLAQINAQLEAQKRQLEGAFKQLKIQQEKLNCDAAKLNCDQLHISQQMDEVEKEYEELEELRDEFDKEKDDFLMQRDKVLAHIAAARTRLEAAAHRMIIEREKFEQENNNNITNKQQQQMLNQLESQRLLMKQMRDAMIQQKVNLEEEKKRLTQPDYLKQEWSKLDAEKEYIASTVKEIEATLQEIEEAEDDNNKERKQLDKLKIQLNERTNVLEKRENQVSKREEYLNEFNNQLEQESKRLKEDIKVNSSMYKNKVKMLKTKNKLLSSRLKEYSVKNVNNGGVAGGGGREMREASELHHLSLNIGVETQKDLLHRVFNSVDEDFYGDNNDQYGSDDFDTDDSYDMTYYDYAHDDDDDLDKEQSADSIGPPGALLPHSTEEVLHIPVGDTPEPPIKKYLSNDTSIHRETPIPIKNKNDIYKSMVSTEISFVESPLTSIESKLELMDSQSNTMTFNKDHLKKVQAKRKSFHQNKAKTITLNKKNIQKKHESIQLQLLTDDMLIEFENLINTQSKISDDIENKIASAFQLLEVDFKSYMQKNVELDADAFENELQQFEDAMYEMEHELEMVQQQRDELEKMNEELDRVVFEMQESDRKKQKIIIKYQDQNKKQLFAKKAIVHKIQMVSSHNQSGSATSNSTASSVEIQKLNKRLDSQPKSYRQYSHADNDNCPFNDDDTDDSDWDVDDDDSDNDSVNGDNSDRFEIVATNRRGMTESLANIEKQFHLEHGLEALALDEDEIEKLKSSHYNKQETLDKLKTLEKQLDEKDKNLKRNNIGLPPTITEEGAEFDDEESLGNNDDEDSWNSHHDDNNLDLLISPDLVADAQQTQNIPPIAPHLATANTIDDLILDCDLVSVGMNESEARKILQELMNLKTAMNTPTLNNTFGMNVNVPSINAKMGVNSNNSNNNTPFTPVNALQQFQHTFQSSKNINFQSNTNINNNNNNNEDEALKRAQEQVFQAETIKNQMANSTNAIDGNNNNFNDIFPTYSVTSQSEFSLKNTTGSLFGIGGVKQQGDMLDSMISNQIELKLQQTQLEAAMTKMELLDELKIEIKIIDPFIDKNKKRNHSKDDFGMPRISTIINLDELAEQLQTK